MRHSRRAVMAERYKLYAKKNIFNSRYFVRNLQIGLLAVVFVATVIGTTVLAFSGSKKEEVVVASAKVSVKDALFGNSEDVKTVTEEVTTEKQTETAKLKSVAITEKVQDELDSTITEVAINVVGIAEEKKQEEKPKSEFDNKCIANVEETLNIRKDPSAEAEFVGSMNPGAIAIVEGVEGDWTKIKSGDVQGYVLTEYVLTGESAEQFAKDYVTLRGTILEDGVNIRSEKSTDADILTVLDKGDIITVLEKPEEIASSDESDLDDSIDEEVKKDDMHGNETVTAVNDVMTGSISEETTEVETIEEEIVWIPVMLEDGQTGYISAELVEIDELYEIAVSAEELQRRAEEEAARKAAEEEAARRAAEEAAKQQQNTTSNSSSEESYQGATTEPVIATESGECIGTFTITAYCGCKKCGSGRNRTASGTVPTEGRTIAADTSVLPFGTKVVINGIVYTVEDRGSGVKGNHIDIFFSTHAKAIAFGRKTIKVYKY